MLVLHTQARANIETAQQRQQENFRRQQFRQRGVELRPTRDASTPVSQRAAELRAAREDPPARNPTAAPGGSPPPTAPADKGKQPLQPAEDAAQNDGEGPSTSGHGIQAGDYVLIRKNKRQKLQQPSEGPYLVVAITSCGVVLKGKGTKEWYENAEHVAKFKL